ncbi:hypothetical protein BURMUCF2_1099 [Burkholderia multivorans CF2]|nr:hypothetical protein BURMUCF2_1099 [Burkholderia multivorans CF2]
MLETGARATATCEHWGKAARSLTGDAVREPPARCVAV